VLSAADYLVVPALWYENDPLVVKAANHVGLPVIASRIGSLERMIDEDENGWLVPPGDVQAWEHVLTRAVADRGRSWRRHPGADMDEHFARVEAIYGEVIGARRGART
jgi:glycosyltransferase involved in cell wall biosynthesis